MSIIYGKVYSQGVLTRYTEYDYDTENVRVRDVISKFRLDEAFNTKILEIDWSYLISQVNLSDNYLI